MCSNVQQLQTAQPYLRNQRSQNQTQNFPHVWSQSVHYNIQNSPTMETILTLPCNFLLHQLIMIIPCFSLIPKVATKVKDTNHEMIPCSLLSQCYLQQQTEPNISASEHITSTHQIISVTQYPNERYFFVCISVCQFC